MKIIKNPKINKVELSGNKLHLYCEGELAEPDEEECKHDDIAENVREMVNREKQQPDEVEELLESHEGMPTEIYLIKTANVDKIKQILAERKRKLEKVRCFINNIFKFSMKILLAFLMK